MAASNEDKLAKALASIVGVGGVVGVGSLFIYGAYKQLRKNTQKNMSNENPKNLDNMPPINAPKEKWNGKLKKINQITVSLVEKPQQDYDELIKDINWSALLQFALEGLNRWCTNTKKHYNQELGSITDAEAWNANFGLLLKIRWAAWLMCLKYRRIDAEDLKHFVRGRTYTKKTCEAIFGDSLVWEEICDEDMNITLNTKRENKKTLDAGIANGRGNVARTFYTISTVPTTVGSKITQIEKHMWEKLSHYVPKWWVCPESEYPI